MGKRVPVDCSLRVSLVWNTANPFTLFSSGVNFIFCYGTQYFENAGFSNPFVISVITK